MDLTFVAVRRIIFASGSGVGAAALTADCDSDYRAADRPTKFNCYSVTAGRLGA